MNSKEGNDNGSCLTHLHNGNVAADQSRGRQGSEANWPKHGIGKARQESLGAGTQKEHHAMQALGVAILTLAALLGAVAQYGVL